MLIKFYLTNLTPLFLEQQKIKIIIIHRKQFSIPWLLWALLASLRGKKSSTGAIKFFKEARSFFSKPWEFNMEYADVGDLSYIKNFENAFQTVDKKR